MLMCVEEKYQLLSHALHHILQLWCGTQMLKPWYICMHDLQRCIHAIDTYIHTIDVFTDYSSGMLDSVSPIQDLFQMSCVEAQVGSTKNEQVRVSLKCPA